MKLRPWRGWEDLASMRALCSRRLAAAPGRANAHPGDIAWWFGWPPQDREVLAERCLLWEDDGVIGFASFFPHEGDLAVFVTPELTHDRRAVAFEETALEWADARATGPVGFAEWEDEHAVIDRWRARGFEPTSAGYLNFVRPLDPAVDGGPVHLAVAPVGAGDVEDRASVTHAAFDNAHRPLGEYVRDYAGFAASPAYPRGWDLLARDLDGSPASCCIAWPDLRSGAGSFEPVATHPSKQRRGFGRMVLSEGFRRLAAAGHRWAIVGTDVGNDGAKALYRSVGFVPDRTVRIFRRS